MASSRAPRRPRTVPCTSSRWRSAARRPLGVEKPSAVIATTASKSSRRRSRYGQARRVSSNSSASPIAAPSSDAHSATSCCASTSSGASCATMASSSPRRTARIRAAHSTRSSRVSGNTRPFGRPPIVCPDRPTRWMSVAMRWGDPIWHTRSTLPMSMPSSSDAVATSTRSWPCLRRVSASSRDSFDKLPWCAATASSPRRSLRWRARRSAILRVFTNTMVVRCWPASSARRS